MNPDPATSHRLHFELSDDPGDLMPRVESIEEFLAGVRCAPAAAQQIAIVAEEILTNIARDAWGEGPTGYCGVDVHAEPAGDLIHVTLRTEDDGVPFDPTAAEEPDLDASLEDREIGGLGIVLIRNMTDTQTYRRIGSRNVFEVTKACARAMSAD